MAIATVFIQTARIPWIQRCMQPSNAVRSRSVICNPKWRINMAVSKRQSSSTPRTLQFPWFRVSPQPLSRSTRLRRVSGAIAFVHTPLLLALLARALLPLPALPLAISERVFLLALAVIVPALRQASCANLNCCAQVARRWAKRGKHDLPTVVRAHQMLTIVVVAGTLSGICTAVWKPMNGTLIVVLFQAAFYLVRRVRFEQGGKVYRCHPFEFQFRDIVWACVMAAAFVGAALHGVYPLLFACATLGVSVMFWVFKYIFVPFSTGLS